MCTWIPFYPHFLSISAVFAWLSILSRATAWCGFAVVELSPGALVPGTDVLSIACSSIAQSGLEELMTVTVRAVESL